MAADTTTISLTCELCSEYFTDPLMLPCLHSFCKKCLLKAKEEQGTEDGCLKCSTCNTSASLPAGKVEGLTQNLWLAHKVKEAFLKDAISSQESIPCSRCIDESSSGTAIAFCCDCCLFLCSLCKKLHQRWRETVRHELVEVGAKKAADNNEMPSIAHQPVNCIQHKKKLKFYCQTCEVLVCRDCILVKHRDHNCKYNDDGEESDTAREALKESVTKCAEVIDSVNGAIASGETMLRQVETRKKEVDNEIKETFSLLQAVLEKRCKDLLMDCEEIAEKKRKVINDQLNEFQKLKGQISHASELALAVVECHDPGEIMSVKKLITDQLARCNTLAMSESFFELKENEAMVTHLDGASMGKEISQFGGVFEVDAIQFSIDAGMAVPLATVGKERSFKITVPNIVDPAEFIDASFVKCDESKEEGKALVRKDNNITTLSCTAPSVGEFQMSLTMRGRHITGSPYQLFVKESRNFASLPNQRRYSVGNYTYGVAVHPSNGNVFASSSSGCIQVFTNDGKAMPFIGTSGNGDGQFNSPFGLVLAGDRLYVTDNGLHRVQYFSTITGEYLGKFGCQGNEEGQFSSPYGISYDGKDKILVADYSNSRVQVFKLDGTFVQVFICNGNPTDVAVDNEGNVHVTIHNQCNVQVFSHDGRCLSTYTVPSGYSQYPQGIAIDDEGYCFITSRYSNAYYLNVHGLDPTGTRTYVTVVGGFSYPWGVALDKEGYVYVADYNNCRIMKY